MKTLSATNLKNALWETLNQIKDDKILAAQGDAIASQAREILRTVKVQLQVVAQSKRSVPLDVIEFAEKQMPNLKLVANNHIEERPVVRLGEVPLTFECAVCHYMWEVPMQEAFKKKQRCPKCP